VTAKDVAAMEHLPALKHVTLKHAVASGEAAASIRRMHCKWEVVQWEGELGPGAWGPSWAQTEFALPHGVKLLRVAPQLDARLDLGQDAGRCEAEVKAWASKIMAAASRVEVTGHAGRVKLQPPPTGSASAAVVAAVGVIKGLAPLASTIKHLSLTVNTCNPVPLQLGAEHVLALGSALGAGLVTLDLGAPVSLAPAAWQHLPALPALSTLRVWLRASQHAGSVNPSRAAAAGEGGSTGEGAGPAAGPAGASPGTLDSATASALIPLCSANSGRQLVVEVRGDGELQRQLQALQPQLAGSAVVLKYSNGSFLDPY